MKNLIRYAGIASVCILLSMLCAMSQSMKASIQIIKYITFAGGVVLLTYTILSFHKKQHTLRILLYIAVCILCIFVILTIDTYWLHALTWFPGILRYALFSTYGWIHFVFFIGIGMLVYYGVEEHT